MLPLETLTQKITECWPRDRYRFSKMIQRLTKKEKCGVNIDEEILNANISIEDSISLYEYRQKNIPQITYPENLPIVQKKNQIIETIKKHQVVIICGETGSGKTTQLPKMCLQAGRGVMGKIGCTQPRRIAATSIAERIREELENSTPDTIGYKIRFTSQDSDKCYIKLMTDGILLAETQNDSYLMEYDTIIIDEAHERSLNIDFLLGYLKQLLAKRPELKVIISSATIDTEKFASFFNNAPIIEVSGRLYPVEVMYMPLDKNLEETGDLTMIDAAVQATDLIMADSETQGDILIFMPAEQDIHETIEKLRKWARVREILPLFGRLPSTEQNRVFRQSNKRKIIVATNIAETSLTIPGIRYVVDSGYARISRYAPRTRTQRLPIEPIAQSSANQRKGRCGRVTDGICIRLYSEEDFESREIFTTPEIRRANLAEVILRMISLNLGDIETFPFLDPPSKITIKDGFDILKELGAIDNNSKLTSLGRQMARLPIDPRTSRMLLEAQKENSLSEVLIIAAALSIPDPKQRPTEKQEEADRVHQQFVDKQSDFMSFLNIWHSYQNTWDELKTQNKVRKFCNKHFLSYMRMREWHDIHKQLNTIMRNENKARVNKEPASYTSIHKSILSGFLSNICSKKEKCYIGRANKEYSIFPGSGQYGKNFDWIVCAELVETSKLFTRTVAKIRPEWIEPLAKDLCSYSYSNPRWDMKNQQVIADERVSLFGLVIVSERRIHYGKINRREARDVFITAIVKQEVNHPFSFLEANQKLIDSVIQLENKIRKHTLLVEEDDLKEFYYNNLPDVVDVKELKHFLQQKSGFDKLYMTKDDIMQRDEPLEVTAASFPDHIMLGTLKMPLEYYFEPVDECDGITLIVPIDLLQQLPSEPFEWLVPGMLEEKILTLLKTLPKQIRKQMMPMADYAQEIYKKMPRSQYSLCDAMQEFIKENYNISIVKQDWQLDKLDLYLQMRFELIDKNENTLAIDRSLENLQNQFNQKSEDKIWRQALEKWTLRNLKTWCFDTLPESVNLTEKQGDIPYLGYPGLILSEGKVNRTLFRSLPRAQECTRISTSFLLDISLSTDLEKLDRILSLSKDLKDDAKHFALSNNLKEESLIFLRNTLLDIDDDNIRTREQFENKRAEIQKHIFTIVPEYTEVLEEIIDEFDKIEEILYNCELCQDITDTFKKEIYEFFPPKFLTFMKLRQLKNYPRYLKCLQIRIQRAIYDFSKDQRKWEEVQPHIQRYKELRIKCVDLENYIKNLVDEYRWMIEEFKISVFAQEIKTLYSISPKRLNSKWQNIVKTLEDA